MNSRIILPLDHMDWEKAEMIMEMTQGMVWGYKIRKTILEKGLCVIQKAKEYGNVMVDFKLYDIPSAIDESVKSHLESGADITTVHCTAGYIPVPVQAKHIAGVTILTSMGSYQYEKYYRGAMDSVIRSMALDAETFRYGYVVCSAQDLTGDVPLPVHNTKKICPGIRPQWYQENDDQKRTMTPKDAVEAGADLLVIGRPILNSSDPIKAIQRTNEEIESAEK